jgi:IclR family KDG regulon transcriptional repressor
MRWPLRAARALCGIAGAQPLPQGHALPLRADADQTGHAELRPRTPDLCAGLRLVRLAHAAWQASSLAPSRGPISTAGRRDGGDRASGAARRGQVLYVDKRNAAASRSRCIQQAGKVGPAYCTGVGKAMLAFCPRRRNSSRAATAEPFPLHRVTITTAEALRANWPRSAPAATPMTARNTSRASSASPCRS